MRLKMYPYRTSIWNGLTPPKVAKTAFAECTSLADIELNEYCTKQQMLDMQAIIDEAGLNCRVWRYENTQTSTAKGASYIYNPNNSDEVYLAGYDGEETQIRPATGIALRMMIINR